MGGILVLINEIYCYVVFTCLPPFWLILDTGFVSVLYKEMTTDVVCLLVV